MNDSNKTALGWRALLVALACTGLGACENDAVSYSIQGKDHALVLVREQRYVWSGEIRQYVVVSRLPQCQRRYPFLPGRAGMLDVKVYAAGDFLWALEQDGEWYLAGTEKCLLQPWANADGKAPGPEVGRFVWRDGAPVFEPTAKAPDQAGG